jgi:pyruvate dehydrogenase E2 component (dihydrolipoamide acetyltransferase)
MAEVVRMPKMSDTMTEGVLAKWHKKVGDKVKSGDLVAEVETDKATMDFESFQEGTILYIGVEEGKAVPVDAIIAVLGKEGEDFKSLLTEAPAAKAAPAAVAEKPAETIAATPAAPVATAAPVVVASSDARIKASPLAKKIAQEKGINLNQIAGSAENGRITKKDVENFKGGASMPAFVGVEKYTEVPVSQMRKTIAKRLSESLFTAPHFYLKMNIEMSNAIEARKIINDVAPVKISFNDLVLKAVALSLKQHPKVNSSWLGDKIRYNEHVNIGVAVAVEDGLLVPVVRFADGKALSQISTEVKTFAQKAKDKKLQPADWEGSTFTISNLGMFGIDDFTAIINPPDACILAVGGIQEEPIVKNGMVVPGNVMKVTLSCDHRVVDGATGAAFLQTLKQYLEEPMRMLLQANNI